MMQDFMTKVLVGFSLIGERTSRSAIAIVTGKVDLEVKCALYYQLKKQPPQTIEDLESEEVRLMLERLKDIIRSDIQKIFKLAANEDKAKVLDELKASNRPHEMGTVAEIAAKYSISKSEVRRRKAEGTLHELGAN